MIKLNETPVRTSRNFKINNIKLEDVVIPELINSFNNVNIINYSDEINVTDKTSNIVLTYGLGNEFSSIKPNNKIGIEINSNKNETIELDFNFDNKNLNLIDDIEIIANKNTKSTVIIKYESEENVFGFHYGVVRVFAKENSEINIVYVNLLNKNSNQFVSFENKTEDVAKINYAIIDFGGKNSISNYYSNLVGEKSENNINAIYLGRENQVFDLNYIGELRGEKTNINIDVQGALKDNAKKHFKGTIDFKKGAKKAKGNENENCMLLSDTAKSIALPMLLCSEEDVEGNHSSSAGKIGEKELFYIMSRGFNKKEAMKLMVRAKFNTILETIQSEELKKQIIEEIEKRMD